MLLEHLLRPSVRRSVAIENACARRCVWGNPLVCGRLDALDNGADSERASGVAVEGRRGRCAVEDGLALPALAYPCRHMEKQGGWLSLL